MKNLLQVMKYLVRGYISCQRVKFLFQTLIWHLTPGPAGSHSDAQPGRIDSSSIAHGMAARGLAAFPRYAPNCGISPNGGGQEIKFRRTGFLGNSPSG